MKVYQLDKTTWPWTNSFEIDYWWYAFHCIRCNLIANIPGI